MTDIGFWVEKVQFLFRNSPIKHTSVAPPRVSLECAIYILTTDVLLVEDFP